VTVGKLHLEPRDERNRYWYKLASMSTRNPFSGGLGSSDAA
jgi:hypothetical protein